ncbi:hypothetical protein WMY93_001225 [Mugilogobius chulae]|uniref:Uncharacterized protein n=1 Tax=Mugilogobius chulae TaxID=88201 RepID=A0AAW0Q4R6_9GOBI
MLKNSENIAEKHDKCLSMEIPIEQQEINICTQQEEEPNKVENNNTELPREPSVRPKNWGRNRYSYNREFRQNFSREYSRGSRVPEFDQSRYQEPSSVQTVAPMEEHEEEPITPKRKNRNRRSKQTLRLQRLLIQPQSNDGCEWTEDDSDGEVFMSQLT